MDERILFSFNDDFLYRERVAFLSHQRSALARCGNHPSALTVLWSTFFLVACLPEVSDVQKVSGYEWKLTETTVYWSRSPRPLKIRIAKSSQGVAIISDKERNESQAKISEALTVYREDAATSLAVALSSAGVRIAPKGAGTLTPVFIQPKKAESLCSAWSCVHALFLEVRVYDQLEHKTVWSGTFRAFPPSPAESRQKLVGDFTNAVVRELEDSGMI